MFAKNVMHGGGVGFSAHMNTNKNEKTDGGKRNFNKFSEK